MTIQIKPVQRNQGFTLIEVIIYIGLFALLLGSAFYTAFQIIDGSVDLSAQATTEEEGHFVLRKIAWAMNGAQTITDSGTELGVTKYDGSNIDMELVSGKVILNGSPITTDNVEVNAIQFTETGTNPNGIEATVTIDGKVFTITKYLRQ